MAEPSLTIVEVWSHNVQRELAELARAVRFYRVIAFDTEFPGCLRNTPKGSTYAKRYEDLRFNVNPTNIIQLGITLSDHDGNVFYKTWQFNFIFDVDIEVASSTSIDFLRSSGRFDFEKLKNDGIDMAWFCAIFSRLVRAQKSRLTWITFHGLFDFGYVLKMVTNFRLPDCVSCFSRQLKLMLGDVLDIKYIAKFCPMLLQGQLGLQKLADILEVDRLGDAHQAGSDSLLTALVYNKMRQNYTFKPNWYTGILYGIVPPASTCLKKPPRNCLPGSQSAGFTVNNIMAF